MAKNSVNKKDTKTIGGQIPQELYWLFKTQQAARHETSTQALEIAIRLYCEIGTQEVTKED